MYAVDKDEPVFAITERDTGISKGNSPLEINEIDVLLDRIASEKNLHKADIVTVKWGKNHRVEIGNDICVINFKAIGNRRIAKCHFFARAPGTQKDGDLFRVTVVNGKVIEERIRIA
ncbi:hypothetical protein HFN65_31585 [Rhizobium laguerreae]|uniref:hypothetical protein n=1 Tax=Rhizobium TaxID=379 RepID=UPI001C903A51|nr:hypothetical protein [Rhizobium laguerreae]MBY3575483.1 hypothetical protein [Rhizobium laguerreae]